LLENQYRSVGKKLPAAVAHSMISFANNFYRKVYPPRPVKEQPFDFSDGAFLQDYLRESTKLFRTKGVLTEFILMARAEIGLYQTLHRLGARVHTSEIVRKYL